MATNAFESGDAEASTTYPVTCSSLRKNGHVIMKGHPCKIVEMLTSKPGKHGHTKIHLVGLDIFTGKKYEELSPGSAKVDVPNVHRQEYIVTGISHDDGFFGLMDDEGEVRDDLKLTSDCAISDLDAVKKMIEEASDKNADVIAVVLKAYGNEVVKDLKIKTY